MGPIVAAIQVIAAIAAQQTIQGLIVRTLLIAGAKMLFQALTPKPKGGAGGDATASGIEQQRQIGEATPRAIALGWTIVAGSECALWASGDSDDNRFNTRVIAISDWPTTLQKIWVRGRELTFEGDINTGWFACNQYRSKSGAARLWMRFVRGDWNQAADAQLISYANANGSWTSEDRLRGVSALLIRREYDVDAFQSGAPDNDDLRVEVKNAPVYDWRDVTQSIGDVTTWKPSENPIVLTENALCLLRAPAQFSPGSTDPIVGPGLDFSRRPLAKLTAMANICDELVSGQPRYRAGGVVNAAMTGREIIDRFAAACAGSWVSSGDGGYLRPGHVPAPVMDIPAGALKANASDRYDPWSRPDDVVNTVIGSYPDPAQAWQITPLPPATDTAWVAADGGVRAAQEDLSFCPYRDQAWRISVRKARGYRLMGARDFAGPHWLIELEPGDVVTAPDPALPYLSTKWWMVQRAVLLAKQDGLTVQLTLNEIDSAIDAAPPALGAAATFTPSSLSRALAVPPVTIGQRVVSGGSGGQYPELTFLIPDSASQASGVAQLQGPATANDNALLAAAQIRNIGLSRGLLHGESVVPGWYRWRAAGRDVDGSVGAFDTTWQSAVQVTAPLVAGEAGSVPWPGVTLIPKDVTSSASAINPNGQFANYLVNGVPPGWSNWVNGTGALTIAGLGSNQNRLDLTAGAGQEAGFLVDLPASVPAGYYVIELAGALFSGTWDGAGAFFFRVNAFSDYVQLRCAVDADLGGLTGNSVGGLRIWRKFVYIGNTTGNTETPRFYFANHYTGIGSIASANRIVWSQAEIRPATDQEIRTFGMEDNADVTGANVAAGFVGQGNQAGTNIYRQSTAPSSPNENDIWEDTSVTPNLIKRYVSGAWVVQGEEGADITALSQRAIVPQFPIIEIKQGEAGHTGNRTVTHTVFAGASSISGGTFSLPAQNLGAGSASVNSSTGTVTISGIVQSGSYTIRYTHTDGRPTDLAVNVTYFPTPPTASNGKIAVDSSANGIASGTYSEVLSLSLVGAPTGVAEVTASYEPTGASGTSTNFQLRLTRAGSMIAEGSSFTGIDGTGLVTPDWFSEMAQFAGFYSAASGTATWAIEARRTSGSGSITTAIGQLVVNQQPT
jgi:hypothetical protein